MHLDDIAPEAATRLLELGGASAASRQRNLDRHWRNIRTITLHNPVAYKARVIGENLLHGTAAARQRLLLVIWAGEPAVSAVCGAQITGQVRAERTRSAAFSPISTDGAWVWPRMIVGITDASATRNPATPRTRSAGSTTLASSAPIRHVPTG